ncbi:TetR/AcrR family transcriptional regulator [Gracilibacillus massiliensis]|uniref:TetR/AcrR family transcriptional regulator n=1 Tax=Gracilibacillus massiliensis TaxID=1564956 RepID=UPI00071CB6A2|nr:TetR/AcrR family transcriptional regulator [Gracilibacillus massiliensis]
MRDYHDRRVRKSKSALKQALMNLLKKRALHQITITDIVAVADLNRGTFYKHYQYKEDLLEEMVDDLIADLIISYREPYKTQEEFSLEQLNASAIKIFDHVESYSDFYRILTQSNILIGIQNRICSQLIELMLEVIQKYKVKQIEPELLASYQAYAIWGLIMEWIRQDFKYSSVYMSKQLLAILQLKKFT